MNRARTWSSFISSREASDDTKKYGWDPILSRASAWKVEGHGEISKGEREWPLLQSLLVLQMSYENTIQLTSLVPLMTMGRPLRQEPEALFQHNQSKISTHITDEWYATIFVEVSSFTFLLVESNKVGLPHILWYQVLSSAQAEDKCPCPVQSPMFSHKSEPSVLYGCWKVIQKALQFLLCDCVIVVSSKTDAKLILFNIRQ